MTSLNRGRWWLGVSLGALALFCLPRRALADDPRLGVDLFQSGRQLMNEGNYEKACPMLRDSQKADPQPGTQINLALCYEKLGQTASAWSTYSDLMQSGGPLQQQAAKAALDRLGPKLSRLRIDVCEHPNFDSSKLVVSRNGEALGESALGRPSPVDAGEYLIEAQVPGYERWSRSVKVSADGDLRSVEICQLQQEPSVNAADANSTQPTRLSVPPTAPLGASAGAAAASGHQRDLMPVYIAAGTGVVAALIGTTFGIVAANQKSDATDLCAGKICSPSGWDKLSSAKTSADISTVGFLVAGAAAGVAVYFVLNPRHPDEPRKPAAAARLAVQVPQNGGLTISYGGAF
jgi:hypothetical protein